MPGEEPGKPPLTDPMNLVEIRARRLKKSKI
jgi:hypothetical protein